MMYTSHKSVMTSEVDAVYGNQKERNLLVQPGNEACAPSPRVHDYIVIYNLYFQDLLFLAVLIRPFRV